jgi:hypothetical protein
LARLWESEFETLVELMSLALVVYIDETGWKVSKKNCYAWVFTTLSHTVLLYGRTRNASVLDEILPSDRFQGIGVSDDYAAYRERFPRNQKCWSHLLRKAIALMLAHSGVIGQLKCRQAGRNSAAGVVGTESSLKTLLLASDRGLDRRRRIAFFAPRAGGRNGGF